MKTSPRLTNIKLTPITPLLLKKYSLSQSIDKSVHEKKQIENDDLIILKHDIFNRICYEYQYQYMKLTNTEKKQYINEIIGHQSIFKRIIFYFNPNDSLLSGICIWISLNIVIIMGFFCHFFPLIWFGYIYIYHINYLNRNVTNSDEITNWFVWLSDEYDNYQHLLITTVTLIYVILIVIIIPYVFNLIKQIHYIGYISKILISGHHPSVYTVKKFYKTLHRNVVVMDCIGLHKISKIILSFIEEIDTKSTAYNDIDFSNDESNVGHGSIGLEITSQ